MFFQKDTYISNNINNQLCAVVLLAIFEIDHIKICSISGLQLICAKFYYNRFSLLYLLRYLLDTGYCTLRGNGCMIKERGSTYRYLQRSRYYNATTDFSRFLFLSVCLTLTGIQLMLQGVLRFTFIFEKQSSLFFIYDRGSG